MILAFSAVGAAAAVIVVYYALNLLAYVSLRQTLVWVIELYLVV